MKKSIVLIVIFFLLSCGVDTVAESIVFDNDCGKIDNSKLQLTLHKDENSPTGIFIPKNLNESFSELDKMLHPDLKSYLAMGKDNISSKQPCEFHDFFNHMRLGLFLRNNWGLWGDNRLVEYFNRIGVFHPDDMSGIILRSYERYLQKKPIKLEEQINAYKKYWEKTKYPTPFLNPKTGLEVRVRSARYLGSRYIYVGYSKDTDDVWFFEYDKGWYRPDNELLEKLGISK